MPASNWVGRAHAWGRMTQDSSQRNPLEQSICKRRGNRGDRRAFESHLQNQDRSRAQGNDRANARPRVTTLARSNVCRACDSGDEMPSIVVLTRSMVVTTAY